jgi:hypothetical protein
MEEVVVKEKQCNRCKNVKDVSLFHRDKSTEDGIRNYCKECLKAIVVIPINVTQKQCKRCNTVKKVDMFHRDKNKADGYRYMCIECMSKYRNTPEEFAKRVKYRENTFEHWKQWYNSSIVQERTKVNQLAYRPKRMETFLNRYKNDTSFKIKILLRGQLRRFMSNISTSYENILGCDLSFFKKWLEYRFDENMNWDNMGYYWEIDHILPLSKFNTSIESEKMMCGHWTNLQPLEKIENRIKNGKLQLHYFFNNIVNINRFNTKYNQFLGYEKLKEMIVWLRIKISGIVKMPRIKVSKEKLQIGNPQPSS